MNGRFDLHIITQPQSEVYCGYFPPFSFGEFIKRFTTYRLVFMLNLPIPHVCLGRVYIFMVVLKAPVASVSLMSRVYGNILKMH